MAVSFPLATVVLGGAVSVMFDTLPVNTENSYI